MAIITPKFLWLLILISLPIHLINVTLSLIPAVIKIRCYSQTSRSSHMRHERSSLFWSRLDYTQEVRKLHSSKPPKTQHTKLIFSLCSQFSFRKTHKAKANKPTKSQRQQQQRNFYQKTKTNKSKQKTKSTMSLSTTTTNNNRLLSLLLLVGLTAFPNVVSADFLQCPPDTYICPIDGREIVRDPFNNCEFPSCDGEPTPSEVTCDGIMPKLCPDGHFAFPDPANNCLYTDDCEGPSNCVVGCELGPMPCPDGSFIYPDYCSCTYPACPIIHDGFNRKLLRGGGKSGSTTTTVNDGERKA